MTPLMLYWAACFLVCGGVIAGTVLRQVYLRGRQRSAMTAKILPMERSADFVAHRPWSVFGAEDVPADGERRRAADRRRNGADRRARTQPHA